MKYVDHTLFTPQEMQSSFDAIKEIDGEGHECWNPRKLAQWLEYVSKKNKNGSISFPICTRKGVLGYILNKSQFYFRND